MNLVDDQRITGYAQLGIFHHAFIDWSKHRKDSPESLQFEIPLTQNSIKTISQARKEAADIITNQSTKLLVIIGPCSIHDPIAAIDYAKNLCLIAKELDNELLIVMYYTLLLFKPSFIS